jgi:hypothetical protein
LPIRRRIRPDIDWKVADMTRTEPHQSQTRHLKKTILIVTTVVVLIIVTFWWQVIATTKRTTALETQLQGLVDTLDQRSPAGDWQDELGRAMKQLEGRVDDQMRSDRLRLLAELDARTQALAAASSTSTFEESRPQAEAFTPAAGEVTASNQVRDSVTDSFDRSRLGDEELFEEMFSSMRVSLGLEKYRLIEVEAELEKVLKSFWPEYIELSKSQNPDTANLRRRYCSRLETVLEPEEVERLGCGGGKVVNSLQQPPDAETIQ